ncbi:MAG: FMN-binding protein [Clostridium butyricum]
MDKLLFNQKVPNAIVSSKSTKVDTISGATHSSNGIISTV